MDHALWWDGVAGALIGAVLGSVTGSGIPLFSAWSSRRVERRGEITAMQVEMYNAKRAMKALLTDKVAAPAYRLPLTMFERALPKLIGEGSVTVNETAALVEYVMRAEEINHGLERAGQAATINQTNALAGEFNRNRQKVGEFLSEKLARHENRTVFDAAEQTLARLEGQGARIGRPARLVQGAIVRHWLHFAALPCEAFGSLLVFLETQRMSVQLQNAGHVDYAGQAPAGYQGWWHNSGRIGFALLLAGIILTGIAIFIDHLRKE